MFQQRTVGPAGRHRSCARPAARAIAFVAAIMVLAGCDGPSPHGTAARLSNVATNGPAVPPVTGSETVSTWVQGGGAAGSTPTPAPGARIPGPSTVTPAPTPTAPSPTTSTPPTAVGAEPPGRMVTTTCDARRFDQQISDLAADSGVTVLTGRLRMTNRTRDIPAQTGPPTTYTEVAVTTTSVLFGPAVPRYFAAGIVGGLSPAGWATTTDSTAMSAWAQDGFFFGTLQHVDGLLRLRSLPVFRGAVVFPSVEGSRPVGCWNAAGTPGLRSIRTTVNAAFDGYGLGIVLTTAEFPSIPVTAVARFARP